MLMNSTSMIWEQENWCSLPNRTVISSFSTDFWIKSRVVAWNSALWSFCSTNSYSIFCLLFVFSLFFSIHIYIFSLFFSYITGKIYYLEFWDPPRIFWLFCSVGILLVGSFLFSYGGWIYPKIRKLDHMSWVATGPKFILPLLMALRGKWKEIL